MCVCVYIYKCYVYGARARLGNAKQIDKRVVIRVATIACSSPQSRPTTARLRAHVILYTYAIYIRV